VAIPRAEWTADDGLRPLTDEGERAMLRRAPAIAHLCPAPGAIVTSPLLRARRTAEIVAEALGMAERLIEDDRLAHGFDIRDLAAILKSLTPIDEVMLVGHEPEFSAAISELIGGGTVKLRKGGLACVDVSNAHRLDGTLDWLLTPSLLSEL
jgi:phosphohistidine phosphatase